MTTNEIQASEALEFGMDAIPNGWKLVCLGDLVTPIQGGTPSKSRKDYWGGYIPFVTGSDLTDFQIGTHHARSFLTIKGLYSGDTVICEPGSLLLATRTGVGRVAIADEIMGASQDITMLSLSVSVDPYYLYWMLQNNADQLQRSARGTSIQGVTQSDVNSLPVMLPPIVEQRAIAAALSNVDGLLDSLDSLIAKKQAVKEAAMQQLLTGRTRLPGFMTTTKSDDHPLGWRSTTIGAVADIVNGGTPNTEVAEYWGGEIPWCIPTDITGTLGKYLATTERRVTERGLLSSGANLLPPGSLLLCSRATIGDVKIATTEVCTNQGFKSLVCKDQVSNEFMYYLLLTLKSRMTELATGSTFRELSKHDLTNISITLPPMPEQAAIAAVLSDMDDEISALERRREKTEAVKRGMMQELLTGRVRLAEAK